MTIDSLQLDLLTEEELHDLNHRIVERLRFLQQARAHRLMLDFRRGERVCFTATGRGLIEGVIARYNKKTVTVITEGGQQWNVSTVFLERVAPAAVEAKQITHHGVASSITRTRPR